MTENSGQEAQRAWNAARIGAEKPEAAVATENVIRIMCPNMACKRVLAVPAHARGKLVRCRGCAINIRIPITKTKDEGGGAPPASGEAA